MLLNYLKFSTRLLLRNPFFTILNVAGLAAGFASFFGLWNYAVTELRSDQFHKDYERIARIQTDWSWTDDHVSWGHMVIQGSPALTIPAIENDFPEIESFVRTSQAPVLLALPGSNDAYREPKTIYADPTLFEFFTIPLVHGIAENVLREANSIVLSRSMAHKFFGDKDPVNQMMILNGKQTVTVTGVFEDLPHNSHLDFKVVLSNQSSVQSWNTIVHHWTYNYARFTTSDFSGFQEKLNAKVDSYWAPMFRYYPRVKAKMMLLPLKDTPFVISSDYWNYPLKSRASLKGMAAIGLVVLIMSWINYINLTISRTAKRMKEVATRKISGAGSPDLLKQFLIESLVTNVLAVALAATFLQLFRAPLATLLDIHVESRNQIDLDMAVFFASVIVLGIAITGLYPTIQSYTTNPTRLFRLHGKGFGRQILPSFLTTSQYTFAVMFTFCALVLHQQLDFIFNKDLGFDQRNALFVEPALNPTENYTRDLENFRQLVLQESEISAGLITSQQLGLTVFKHSAADMIKMDGVVTEENFVPFFKHKLIAGRDFLSHDREDVVIVTQHVAERLGYSLADAVGRTLYVGDYRQPKEIVGVIENFRLYPFLKSENSELDTGRGLVLIYSTPEKSQSNVLILKVAQDKNAVIAKIEKMYNEFFPGNAFSGFYFEDELHNPYNREQILRRQISFFTLLAVSIACLGLLGMMATKVVEKTREIGIRKALGAGTSHLASVLLRSAVYHLVIAIFAGLAIAYFVSLQYLERYTERISFNIFHFAVPVVLLIAILGATISVLLIRAFKTNPVEALKEG